MALLGPETVRDDRRGAVWKLTSELGYEWTLVKLHAIEQMQLRRQHRVDGVGRPKFDSHTGADKFIAVGQL